MNDPASSSTGTTSVGSTDPSTESSSGTPLPETSESGSTAAGDSSSSTGAPESGACDSFAPDCPEGQKCMPWDDTGGAVWNAQHCVDIVDDPAALGESCEYVGSPSTGEDTCDAGLMCWNLDLQTGQGECVAQCGGSIDAPECAEGTTCQLANGGALALCVLACDPLAQSCGDGQACYPSQFGFACAPVANPGVQGEGCSFINTCAAGLLCAAGTVVPNCEDMACCTRFCDASDPSDDCSEIEGSAVCAAFFAEGMAPAGLDDVGVCVTPQ